MSEHWLYLIVLAVAAALLWRRKSVSTAAVKALLEKGAQIVDVRSKAEFKAGSHPKSINIPLDELEKNLKKLDATRPVLVCCASGSRSGAAVSILKGKGFKEVHNLGSWQRIQSFFL
jgi:rhodanese-related sulfurtransferase